MNEHDNEQKLATLAEETDTILFSCRTVFPFTLFPDSISIDQTKITVSRKIFFLSESMYTILISDLKFVHVNTSPFFAQVIFEIAGHEQNPTPIKYLLRRDAIKLKEIAMGLVTAKKEGISMQGISKKSILKNTKKIGTTRL
jgi:hypothetical protein